MRWRPLVFNRFVLVPGAILAAALLWNLYVSFHDGGTVAGRVVDAAGRPVGGAEVLLLVLNVTTFADSARTQTDAEGRFRFTDNPSHHIQLQAEAPSGRSERLTVRLWFRGQDLDLPEPIVLRPRS
jgi:hypothetical protein